MTTKTDVLFVCLHGSAKSLIAARHLERLAATRGIRLVCDSAGVDPDLEIPSHVVNGLQADGVDVSAARPARVGVELIAKADRVVSFGCDLTTLDGHPTVTRWDDVPLVSEGYTAARDDIAARLQTLLEEIINDHS